MLELETVEPTLKFANFLAVGSHGVASATRFLHDLIDHELGVTSNLEPLKVELDNDFKPVHKCFYSATLLEAGKCKRIAYFIHTPRGETKTSPAPAPLCISDPSGYMT